SVWKLIDAGGKDPSDLLALDFSAGVGILIDDQLDKVDLIVAIARAKDVVKRVDIGSAKSNKELVDLRHRDSHCLGNFLLRGGSAKSGLQCGHRLVQSLQLFAN